MGQKGTVKVVNMAWGNSQRITLTERHQSIPFSPVSPILPHIFEKFKFKWFLHLKIENYFAEV